MKNIGIGQHNKERKEMSVITEANCLGDTGKVVKKLRRDSKKKNEKKS